MLFDHCQYVRLFPSEPCGPQMPGTHIEVDEYIGLVVMTELEPLVKAVRDTTETCNMAKRASQA